MSRRKEKGDKRWFGLAVLAVGVFILLKRFDLFYFNFHTMWPWVVIAVGVLVGIKNKFRNHAWWILITIGTAHLIEPFTVYGVSSSKLLVPAGLIVLGLLIIFGRGKNKDKGWKKKCDTQTFTNDSGDLNIDVTFGGHKELVTSKDFRGGKISGTFGGVEVNLMNAESQQREVELNVSATFAGVEIIIPSHWELSNEVSTSLGSVEDHRTIYTRADTTEEKTTLILRGNVTFGSIEIKSY